MSLSFENWSAAASFLMRGTAPQERPLRNHSTDVSRNPFHDGPAEGGQFTAVKEDSKDNRDERPSGSRKS